MVNGQLLGANAGLWKKVAEGCKPAAVLAAGGACTDEIELETKVAKKIADYCLFVTKGAEERKWCAVLRSE